MLRMGRMNRATEARSSVATIGEVQGGLKLFVTRQGAAPPVHQRRTSNCLHQPQVAGNPDSGSPVEWDGYPSALGWTQTNAGCPFAPESDADPAISATAQVRHEFHFPGVSVRAQIASGRGKRRNRCRQDCEPPSP